MALETVRRRTTTMFFGLALACEVGGLALTACTASTAGPPPGPVQPSTRPAEPTNSPTGPESLKGKPAPDVTLTSADGKVVKLSSLRGKVVLLDFWATWCPPCVKALPHLDAIAADPKLKARGLEVWAVNSGEPADKVKKFVTDKKLSSVTVQLDVDRTLCEAFLIDPLPTTLLVGADGKLAWVLEGGGELAQKDLDAAIETVLAAAAKAK